MLARTLTAAVLSFAAAGQVVAADLPKREKAPLVQEVKAPSFFLFSDTQVSYRYSFPAAEPGIGNLKTANPVDGRNIPKHILNISHADAWEYGTNFFSLDILKSGSQDPAGTSNGPGGANILYGSGDVGATEAYGLYRGTLNLNALFKTSAFAIPGLIKAVSLSYGFDANTKNTIFGPEKRLAVGGLSFAVDVPAGFLNVAVHASHEWNRNGIVDGPARSVEFETTPEFEIVYNFPLTFTGLPLSIAGFNNIVMPKGRDGFGDKTVLEFLSRTNLVLDIGKLVYNQPNKVDAFIGFQYWRNKFGNDQRSLAGAEEKSFLAGFAFHIF